MLEKTESCDNSLKKNKPLIRLVSDGMAGMVYGGELAAINSIQFLKVFREISKHY